MPDVPSYPQLLQGFLRRERPSPGGYFPSTALLIESVAGVKINWCKVVGLGLNCHVSSKEDADKVVEALIVFGLDEAGAYQDSDSRGESWWMAGGFL